ncbi:MAG: DUF444 family protein [bacterium]
MNSKEMAQLLSNLREKNLNAQNNEHVKREIMSGNNHDLSDDSDENLQEPGIYGFHDLEILQDFNPFSVQDYTLMIKTLEELLSKDKQREKDGFPRRIRIGKLIRPGSDGKGKVVVVPTTTEPKFYHDNRVEEEQEEVGTGGSGEGEEGDVIGEQPVKPQQGEGEGQGAGEGEGAEHDVSSNAFDLGKMLTEKFKLPNLKDKGKKRSLTRYKYDLTDRNRGFGQLLDKKATLRRIVKTNMLLGNISPGGDFKTEDFIISPEDHIYRILSREKDFETQAMVFFLRDYSGSMDGPPTEAVTTQHLLIYSWLMYQYSNNVETRFIVHDTEAKEVDDFETYYRSQVAGGTKCAPAFNLVNSIIENENIAKDYNIYVFYGTDGDDWDSTGKEFIKELGTTLRFANRTGITVAKNSWGSSVKTTVEKHVEKSGFISEKPNLLKIDTFKASEVSENRIIESIKKLIEQ